MSVSPPNENVKLNKCENPWKPKFKINNVDNLSIEEIASEELYKEVRGILNKLTRQNFSKLVVQLKSLPINIKERLEGIVDLVYMKAINEPLFVQLYANMCKQLSDMEVTYQNEEGKDFKVNFRILIITRCQSEFESERHDELEVKPQLEEIKNCDDPEKKKELKLLFEEHARLVRKKSIGNIKFIGELFKLQLLTANIMHRCLQSMVKKPKDESLECLCTLLYTVGKQLEFDKNAFQLHQIFQQINLFAQKQENFKISSKVRFMLQDVIDLRKNRWKPKGSDLSDSRGEHGGNSNQSKDGSTIVLTSESDYHNANTFGQTKTFGTRVLQSQEPRTPKKNHWKKAWKYKNLTKVTPSHNAGPSEDQDVWAPNPVSNNQPATPTVTSGNPPVAGEKKLLLRTENTGREKKTTRFKRHTVKTVRPDLSFAEMSSVVKVAIVCQDHPETRLSEETAQLLRLELGRRAIWGKDVRMTSCQLVDGAIVVKCANSATNEWLEKEVLELNPFKGVQLKIDPSKSPVRMVKVTTFVPESIGAKSKKDVMTGLKHQSGLSTDHWVVVGGNVTPDGQFLVINIDENSLQDLTSLAMRPFVGCGRITFKLQEGSAAPAQPPS